LRFAPPELQASAFEVRIDRRGGQTLLMPVPLGVLSPPAEFCKSLLDRSVAFIALCALSPLLVATAVAIRLEGPGPALFRQLRVGRNGRSFNVFKFRSMRLDAGENWATTNDDRVTRVGAFIRKYSIDELPQLLNVLRGEMSLVGPRPEMREYADRFSMQFQRYADRHLVRPGITGWTQINMRRNLTPSDVEEVLESDLFYIENWSFLLDLSILFKTACEVFFHRGV
jgi:lipopolysaccharide/colanic/teichoic acid biosynthesis glycosyltransferase